jgi:hypothetical protein
MSGDDQFSETSRNRPSVRNSVRLSAIGLIAVVIDGVGSLILMLRVGQNNPSILLMAMFSIWVVSPFVGLVVSTKVVTRRFVLNARMISSLMLSIPIISLAFYTDVVLRPRPQPAFMFLVVPLGSWLVIIAVGAAAILSQKRSDH